MCTLMAEFQFHGSNCTNIFEPQISSKGRLLQLVSRTNPSNEGMYVGH